jgi:hypothetical protein
MITSERLHLVLLSPEFFAASLEGRSADAEALISPTNAPSLALAGKLGFEQVGKQMDLEDGLEYVFELEIPV